MLRWRPRPPCLVVRELRWPTIVVCGGSDIASGIGSPGSTPRVRPSGAASQRDLCEQPAWCRSMVVITEAHRQVERRRARGQGARHAPAHLGGAALDAQARRDDGGARGRARAAHRQRAPGGRRSSPSSPTGTSRWRRGRSPCSPSSPATGARRSASRSTSATGTSRSRSTATRCWCPTTRRWSSSSHASVSAWERRDAVYDPIGGDGHRHEPGTSPLDGHRHGQRDDEPTMAESAALLSLLHFADSAFPTGGYAHSFGLERYCQAGIVRDRDGLERFLAGPARGRGGAVRRDGGGGGVAGDRARRRRRVPAASTRPSTP